MNEYVHTLTSDMSINEITSNAFLVFEMNMAFLSLKHKKLADDTIRRKERQRNYACKLFCFKTPKWNCRAKTWGFPFIMSHKHTHKSPCLYVCGENKAIYIQHKNELLHLRSVVLSSVPIGSVRHNPPSIPKCQSEKNHFTSDSWE